MRNDCPADEWEPDPEEVDFLAAFGSRRDAILAIGDMDNVERWRLGELSGLSGGVTEDVEQRKRNWASAAYKKCKHRKETLPPIAALQQQLQVFRAVGSGKSSSVTHRQTIEKLDYWIMHGEPNHSISAARAKAALTGRKGDVGMTAEEFLAHMVRKVGPERARRGFEEFDMGYIVHRAPDLFEPKPDDTEQRIAALEAKHEADRDGKGSSGNMPDDAPRDGARAVSGSDAVVDRSGGPPVTGGVGGDRREREAGDAMRDADGSVLTDEQLRQRQSEIFGL